MSRLRTIGLMMLALVALGAFTVSAASAVEGVSPPTNFSGTGGAAELATLGNEKITCTALKLLEGKFLTEKEQTQHGTANLHLSGCKVNEILPANTLGDEKEVILIKVLFLICLVISATLTFGILILPQEAAHIEVPSISALLLVKGSAIAQLEGAGLKGKVFQFVLKKKKEMPGDQETALECNINGKTFKHSLEAAKDSSTDEMTSLEVLFTITFDADVNFVDS
jgi:hypothetical protein